MATSTNAHSAAPSDGLREFVNEDAEHARRQALLMQEYGDTMPQQTPQGPTTTTTSSTSASSGCGGATKDVKNKFEKQKPQTLSRRHSGEEPRRCLSQAMDNAAGDKMEEAEMIPDNEYGKQKVAEAPAPVQQPPAQGSGEQNNPMTESMDFWARMGCLMERKTEKINVTVESLGGRIDQVKKDLESSIAEEIKKRDNLQTSLDAQMDQAQRRLAALERPAENVSDKAGRRRMETPAHHPRRLHDEATTRTSGGRGETMVEQAR